MKKQWIWFDLGYTLLFLKREKLFQQILADRGKNVPLEKIEMGFHLTDKLFMREYPRVLGNPHEVYLPWYHGHLVYTLGTGLLNLFDLFKDWKAGIKTPLDSWDPYPFVADELKALKEAGYKLGVISNWDDSARKILDKHGLTVYFDNIVISSEIGVEKPKKEIFEHAFSTSGAKAGESLYVGDNYYDDHVGSQTVGMDCMIINRFGNLGVEEINDVPIIPDIRAIRPYLEREED